MVALQRNRIRPDTTQAKAPLDQWPWFRGAFPWSCPASIPFYNYRRRADSTFSLVYYLLYANSEVPPTVEMLWKGKVRECWMDVPYRISGGAVSSSLTTSARCSIEKSNSVCVIHGWYDVRKRTSAFTVFWYSPVLLIYFTVLAVQGGVAEIYFWRPLKDHRAAMGVFGGIAPSSA